jgi:hypothetical protein
MRESSVDQVEWSSSAAPAASVLSKEYLSGWNTFTSELQQQEEWMLLSLATALSRAAEGRIFKHLKGLAHELCLALSGLIWSRKIRRRISDELKQFLLHLSI